jgi:hypothetical protein
MKKKESGLEDMQWILSQQVGKSIDNGQFLEKVWMIKYIGNKIVN